MFFYTHYNYIHNFIDTLEKVPFSLQFHLTFSSFFSFFKKLLAQKCAQPSSEIEQSQALFSLFEERVRQVLIVVLIVGAGNNTGRRGL